jgi:N-methylhydantoinase A/oxoprolinase/acetone carboxylase beta subunit
VRRPDCRLGIDVGGANADAVIMDAADIDAIARFPCEAGD